MNRIAVLRDQLGNSRPNALTDENIPPVRRKTATGVTAEATVLLENTCKQIQRKYEHCRLAAGHTDKADVMGMVMRTIDGNAGSGSEMRLSEHTPLQHNPAFQFWSGASGRRYVHSVFELTGCPRLPACTYVLVRRDAQGKRTPVRIGAVSAEAWSLNLAEIRHRAALLSANEVHVHLIADDVPTRTQIAADLQAGQFAEYAAEPAPVPSYLC